MWPLLATRLGGSPSTQRPDDTARTREPRLKSTISLLVAHLNHGIGIFGTRKTSPHPLFTIITSFLIASAINRPKSQSSSATNSTCSTLFHRRPTNLPEPETGLQTAFKRSQLPKFERTIFYKPHCPLLSGVVRSARTFHSKPSMRISRSLQIFLSSSMVQRTLSIRLSGEYNNLIS